MIGHDIGEPRHNWLVQQWLLESCTVKFIGFVIHPPFLFLIDTPYLGYTPYQTHGVLARTLPGPVLEDAKDFQTSPCANKIRTKPNHLRKWQCTSTIRGGFLVCRS